MAVLALVIAAATVVVLIVLSRRAGQRLQQFERLPMQYDFSGHPTWYAPRRIALGFTPVLAGVTLTGTAAIPLFAGEPMTGRGAAIFLGVVVLSAVFWLATHAGQLWMQDRWARKQG